MGLCAPKLSAPDNSYRCQVPFSSSRAPPPPPLQCLRGKEQEEARPEGGKPTAGPRRRSCKPEGAAVSRGGNRLPHLFIWR